MPPEQRNINRDFWVYYQDTLRWTRVDTSRSTIYRPLATAAVALISTTPPRILISGGILQSTEPVDEVVEVEFDCDVVKIVKGINFQLGQSSSGLAVVADITVEDYKSPSAISRRPVWSASIEIRQISVPVTAREHHFRQKRNDVSTEKGVTKKWNMTSFDRSFCPHTH